MLELNYADNLSDGWIIDSGATDHVCSSLQVLNKARTLNEGELSLKLGNDDKVAAEAVGEVHLAFRNKFLVLLGV